MSPKDTRSAAQKARDTASIIGSLMHEGYVPNPEDEAIHKRAERGEIPTEEAIAIFRERAVELQREALAVTDQGRNCDRPQDPIR
jgi:Antitoxin VbhA